MSIAQIARRLHLSPHTVRNHVRSAAARLGARTTLEAVVSAARHGLVDVTGAD
ncbi:MAG: response regulator transcription factor [Actinomycetota bacterium]